MMINRLFENYPDIIGIKDLCKMLGIGRNLAYAAVSNGIIRSKKVGRRYIITKAAVIEYLNSGESDEGQINS